VIFGGCFGGPSVHCTSGCIEVSPNDDFPAVVFYFRDDRFQFLFVPVVFFACGFGWGICIYDYCFVVVDVDGNGVKSLVALFLGIQGGLF
jgi:hypothetical protein